MHIPCPDIQAGFYFSPKEAEVIAEANNAADGEWVYVVDLRANGRAVVQVYDEDGLIGTL